MALDFRQYLVCVAAPLSLIACAGSLRGMREVSPDQVDLRPDPTRATVIVMRPSGLAFGVSSSVFEIRPDGNRFVGIVPARKMLAYRAEPGVTRFMVVSESEDFLEATLIAGKTYYALISPRPGVGRARFLFVPVHAGQFATDLPGYQADCSWVENTEGSRKWADAVAGQIESRKKVAVGEWEARKERPALLEADGM